MNYLQTYNVTLTCLNVECPELLLELYQTLYQPFNQKTCLDGLNIKIVFKRRNSF